MNNIERAARRARRKEIERDKKQHVTRARCKLCGKRIRGKNHTDGIHCKQR